MEYFYRSFIPAIWVVWLIYWLAAAKNVKATAKNEDGPQKSLYWVLLILGASLFSIVPPGLPVLGSQIYPRSLETFWGGCFLLLIGFGVTVWARRTLGRNWSSSVSVKQNHELIQTGPYAWVRHPIYTGLLLMFIGSGLAVGQWRILPGMALVLTSFLIKLRIEERFMTEVFGATYQAYRKHTAMLIPFVW